jgi:hypothetical protein
MKEKIENNLIKIITMIAIIGFIGFWLYFTTEIFFQFLFINVVLFVPLIFFLRLTELKSFEKKFYKQEKFIRKINKELEYLDVYREENFGELKNKIIQVRKMINDFNFLE